MLLYQPVQNSSTFGNVAGDLLNELDASCESFNRVTLDALFELEADGALQTMFGCDPASTTNSSNNNNTTSTERVCCAADQLFGEFAFDQTIGSYSSQNAFTSAGSTSGLPFGFGGSTMPSSSAMTFQPQQQPQQQQQQQLQQQQHQTQFQHGTFSVHHTTSSDVMSSGLSQSSMDGNGSYASNAASPLGGAGTTMACSEYSQSESSYTSPPHTPTTLKPTPIYATHPLSDELQIGFASTNAYSPSHDSMINQIPLSPPMLNNHNNVDRLTVQQSIKCESSPDHTRMTANQSMLMNDQQLDLKLEDIDSALDDEESELDELLLDENSLGSIALSGDLGTAFTPAFTGLNATLGGNGGGPSSFASSLGFGSGWTSVASNYTPTNIAGLTASGGCNSTNMLPNNVASNRCDPLLGGFHHTLPSTPASLNNTPMPPATIADNNVFSRTNTPLLNSYGNISPCNGDLQNQLLLPQSNSLSLIQTHQSQPSFGPFSSTFKMEPKEEPCEGSLSQCSACSYSTNYSVGTPTCAAIQSTSSTKLSTVNATGAISTASNLNSSPRFDSPSFVPSGSYPFVSNQQLDQLLGSTANSSSSPIHQSPDYLNFASSATGGGFARTNSNQLSKHSTPPTTTFSAVIRPNKPTAVHPQSNLNGVHRLMIKNGSTLAGIKHHQHQLQQQAQQQHQSSSAQPTSLLCAVCGDSAACQHYGVRTCEGCKGFFKRTVQKSSKYVCLANRDCVVDKRRRNRCQFCRFQKCLVVGMVKEVVRTDSLKGRRGRLPSKAKHPQIAGTASNVPFSTIAHLQNAINELCPTLQNRKSSPFVQIKQETIDCRSKQSPYSSAGFLMKNFYTPGPNELQSLKQIAFDFTQQFARKVPGFVELDSHDQTLLIRNACLEVYTLFFAYRNTSGASSCWFSDCLELARHDCELFFGEWFFAMQEFAQRLQAIQIDQQSFVSLLAIALISERFGLTDSRKVELLQMRLIDTLRDHVTYDSEAQRKPHYFSKLFSILPALRSFSALVEPNLTQETGLY